MAINGYLIHICGKFIALYFACIVVWLQRYNLARIVRVRCIVAGLLSIVGMSSAPSQSGVGLDSGEAEVTACTDEAGGETSCKVLHS